MIISKMRFPPKMADNNVRVSHILLSYVAVFSTMLVLVHLPRCRGRGASAVVDIRGGYAVVGL